LSDRLRAYDLTERPPDLLPEAEAPDYLAIAIDVATVDVTEVTAPLAYQLEEASPGVVVVLVNLEVFRQVLDAVSQESDLHL
jgi:hypothetical protein